MRQSIASGSGEGILASLEGWGRAGFDDGGEGLRVSFGEAKAGFGKSKTGMVRVQRHSQEPMQSFASRARSRGAVQWAVHYTSNSAHLVRGGVGRCQEKGQ